MLDTDATAVNQETEQKPEPRLSFVLDISESYVKKFLGGDLTAEEVHANIVRRLLTFFEDSRQKELRIELRKEIR